MLRRIISGLRRQDWTAVAVELIVVIAGVFIGVQASNWNEQRETNQKAAVFTARLKADLRKEAWMYELETGYLSEVLVNAKRAADGLTGKAPLSDEALLIAAYRATQDYPYTRYSATYDQLTSTGQMGLIRDSALRDLAMRVYTEPFLNQIGSPQQQSEDQYRKAFRMVLPYEVQESLNEKCGDRVVPIGDYRGIAHMLDHPCATELPPTAITASVARLRSDPQLLALLQLRIANVETNRILLTTLWARGYREPLRRLAREKP
jgi:hypothetical protein